jgi:hypothetical protein
MEIPTGVLGSGFPLAIPRTRHTATLLKNGKILIAGGSVEGDDFALDEEIVDPLTGASSWAAPLHTARQDHSATLLQDGRVLVVGGYNAWLQWVTDAEIYDPQSNSWTVIPPLFPHGTAHTATLMQDGRVLIAGGCIGGYHCTEKVEIFDPRANLWIEAAPLASDRMFHTAQLLNNGRVLVAGGITAYNEIPVDGTAILYHPETNTWSETAPMAFPRYGSQSIKLPSGDVLVAGGVVPQTDPPSMSNAVEVYDPVSNSWRTVSSLVSPRFAFVLRLLANGQVLAIAGTRDWDCCWTRDSFVREVEMFDPATGRWQSIGELPAPGAFSTGTQLEDGRIWITGGQAEEWVLDETWLIQP